MNRKLLCSIVKVHRSWRGRALLRHTADSVRVHCRGGGLALYAWASVAQARRPEAASAGAFVFCNDAARVCFPRRPPFLVVKVRTAGSL
jgi:hypothetical protein